MRATDASTRDEVQTLAGKHVAAGSTFLNLFAPRLQSIWKNQVVVVSGRVGVWLADRLTGVRPRTWAIKIAFSNESRMNNNRIELGELSLIKPDTTVLSDIYRGLDSFKLVELPFQELASARENASENEHFDMYEARNSFNANEYPLPVIDISEGKNVMIQGWSAYDRLVEKGVSVIPVLLVARSAQAR